MEHGLASNGYYGDKEEVDTSLLAVFVTEETASQWSLSSAAAEVNCGCYEVSVGY